MSKFEVGDRLAAYGSDGRAVVTVEGFDGEILIVSKPCWPNGIRVHSKQCRKLVPAKLKRRVWMPSQSYRNVLNAGGAKVQVYRHTHGDPDWVEFVEVRKKK